MAGAPAAARSIAVVVARLAVVVVDDESDLEGRMTLEECRELLAHRSFVRAPRVTDAREQTPFYWSLTLRRDALPPDSRVALEVARGSGWTPLRP